MTRRYYPGYMLVEMELDNETWHLVKNTPKVTGFVGGTRRNPPPVPDSEVARITSMLTDDSDEPRPVLDRSGGGEVRLTEGRYASMRGTVEDINEARGEGPRHHQHPRSARSRELSFHQIEEAHA
ncbi:MAG: transcription termination/antitermination protein NusG [Myxococcota bacterium]